MELAIITTPDGGLSIKDFETIKTELTQSLAHYKTLVFTADEIKAAKDYRAQLNKTSDALKENFRNKKKELLAQLDVLDRQTSELVGIVWECSDAIDKQIKVFEEEEKQKKREACQKIFFGTEGLPDWLTFEQIENPKWTNKTFTAAKVAEEIGQRVAEIKANLDTLAKLEAFSFEAVEEYKRTLDINKAITEGQRLADIQRRKEEAQRLHEEEMARRAAEEEARKAAESEATAGQFNGANGEMIEIHPDEEKTKIEPFSSEETHKLIMTVDGKGFSAEITDAAKADLNKIIKDFITRYGLKMEKIGG